MPRIKRHLSVIQIKFSPTMASADYNRKYIIYLLAYFKYIKLIQGKIFLPTKAVNYILYSVGTLLSH